MNTTTGDVNWYGRRHPVTLDEVTEAMLAPIRAAADTSRLPHTVWPSVFHGPRFVGVDCLLISAVAMLGTTPSCAAPGTDPLFTLIPRSYLFEDA